MAIAFSDFTVMTDSLHPGKSGFSPKSGRATERLFVDGAIASINDLTDAINLLVGTVSLDVGDGRLNRTPPPAHPIYPWMVLGEINSIQGLGTTTSVNASVDMEVPLLATTWPIYSQYIFDVTFLQPPYPVLQNRSIQLFRNQSYTDSSGATQGYDYATEYNRYVDYDIISKESAITAQLGQMKFRTAGGTPDGVNFSGMPKVVLPDQLLKLRWYNVPYRYITSTNSFFPQMMCTVNQSDFLQWKAGQMLLIGYNPVKYTPPVPSEEQFATGVFTAQKVCDIELTWAITNRLPTNVPTPANANYIAAGHNLQPWFTKPGNFYYVTCSDDATKIPFFLSAPHNRLFTDPDAC